MWGGAIGTNVQAAVNLLAGVIIAFIVSWKLALVTCASVPAMIIAGIINIKFTYGLEKQDGEQLEAAGRVASESISGHRTVFAFNLQPRQCAQYDECLAGPAKQAVKKGLVSGFFFGFSQFVMFAGFALAFWYGSELADDGELTFKGILTCSMALLMGAMGAGEVWAAVRRPVGCMTSLPESPRAPVDLPCRCSHHQHETQAHTHTHTRRQGNRTTELMVWSHHC